MFGLFWGVILVTLPLLLGSSNPTYETCSLDPDLSVKNHGNGRKIGVFKCSKNQIFNLHHPDLMNFLLQRVAATKTQTPVMIKYKKDQTVKINTEKLPRDFKNQFFVFFTLLSLFVFGIRKSIIQLDKLFVILGAYLLIVSLISAHTFVSNSHFTQWLMFSFGMVLLTQFICNFKEEDKKYVVVALGISCLIQSTLVIISYFGIDLYKEALKFILNANFIKATDNAGSNPVGIGSMLNSMVTGTFIALTLPSLRKKPIFLAIGLVGLVLSNSIIAIMSFFAGGVIVFYSKILKRRHFLKVTSACSIIFSILLYLSLRPTGFFTQHTRYNVWKQAMSIPRGFSCIFGKGLGYFADFHYPMFHTRMRFLQVHNEFIEIYVAFGLIGLIAIFYYLYTKKDQILNGDTTFLWIFSAALASCFGVFTFHLSPTALVGLIALGMLLKKENQYDT